MASEPTPAQQPDGGAEDAFDKWIHEDHFGVGCEIGMNDTAHSEECVEAAFKDGYAAGQCAPIPPASPEREAVYRAVDAWLDSMEATAKAALLSSPSTDPYMSAIFTDKLAHQRFAEAASQYRMACITAARKESHNG